MSQLTIFLMFGLALVITIIRGPGMAFAIVYLPSLILLNQLPDIPVAHAPFNAFYGPIYGILLGIPFSGEKLRFRLCTVDVVVILLLLSATITSWTTEVFETGVNTFRNELMRWVGPYFLARIVFRHIEVRKTALYSLIAILAVVAFSALIEFRLAPYWYLHQLKNLGMGNYIHVEAYSRFGFFRVSGTVEHPIYFGNMCVAILGLVAVLAKTSGISLKNPWVATALFAAFGCVITSISFTPYIGAIAGTLACLTLVGIPFSRKLILPLTLCIIAALFTFTLKTAYSELGERPEDALGESLYIRRMIVIQSWRQAIKAGPFGFGKMMQVDENEEFNLASVDNTYMQFTMTRGWVYTALWISIGILMSIRSTIGFSKITNQSQVLPLAVATSTVLGLMVAMYTVWGGAVYVIVWAVMLGLCNTLIDMIKESAAMPRTLPVRPGMPQMFAPSMLTTSVPNINRAPYRPLESSAPASRLT